jgi:putative membrane protein
VFRSLSHRMTLAIAVIAVAACAREESRPVNPPYGRLAPPRAAPGPAISSADYVSQASSIELFLIGASELALQKSSNARTREFAQIEIPAHKGLSAQLSLEGRRLNLLPSATLSQRHQAMLNELERSSGFDALYRRDELIVHNEAEALQKRYAATGTSPTLRPLPGVILPVVQRHLRMLKYL